MPQIYRAMVKGNEKKDRPRRTCSRISTKLRMSSKTTRLMVPKTTGVKEKERVCGKRIK